MKKILSILALFACGVFAAQAQVDKTLQFVDKEGKVVENGAELTLTEVEAPWGDDQIVLPLSVKNTKKAKNPENPEDVKKAKAGVRLIFNIMQIDNGNLQVCFPSNCTSVNEPKEYITEKGTLEAGEVKEMATEWLPTAKGKCVATFQLQYFEPTAGGEPTYMNGPKIKVTFDYNPTSVTNVKVGNVLMDVYDTAGKMVLTNAKKSDVIGLTRGVYICKTKVNGKPGKVEKILVR